MRIPGLTRLRATSRGTRQAMVLISGTSLGQLVLIIATPILTRLYTPHEFGVLTLFLVVSQTAAVAANGRYDQAILVADTFEEAIEVCVLSIVTAFAVCLLLMIPVIVWNHDIARVLGAEDLGPWLLLAPLAAFLNCVFSSLTYLNNRMERYGPIAKVTVLRAFAAVAVQIAFGIFSAGTKGLIAGQMFSYFLANGSLVPPSVREVFRSPGSIKWRSLASLAKRMRDFPIYSAPGALIGVLNQNVANVMLSAFFTPAVVGFYALTRRTLSAPLVQIATPIGQIFFRQASEENRDRGSAQQAFDATLLKLLFISVPIFVIAFFIVEDVFRIAFGTEWETAGRFAKIMIPLFAVRFVVSPLSQLAAIVSNKELLFVNSALVVGGVVPFYVGDRMGWPVETSLAWMTAACSLIYLVYLARLRQLSR